MNGGIESGFGGEMDPIEKLAHTLPYLMGVATWISLVVVWYQRRKARKAQQDQLDDYLIHVGDADDLARAEAAVRSAPRKGLSEVKEVLETHRLVERFNTQHGVTETYINDLEQELRRRGLHPRFIRHETVPLGAMGALDRPAIYELYVLAEEVDATEALLAERAK